MAVTVSLDIIQNSQNKENNTSNVTVQVYAHFTGGSYNKNNNATGTLTVDDVSHSFTANFNTAELDNGSELIYSYTTDVAHDTDGSKLLECSVVYDANIDSTREVTASASKQLDTISSSGGSSSSGAFTVTISQGEHTTVAVYLNDADRLYDGDTVDYGADLSIFFSVDDGYELTTHTVNGVEFASGGSYMAIDDVVIVSEAQVIEDSGEPGESGEDTNDMTLCQIFGVHQAWSVNNEDRTEHPLEYLQNSAITDWYGESPNNVNRIAMIKLLIPNYVGSLKDFTFTWNIPSSIGATKEFGAVCALASSDVNYTNYLGGWYNEDENLILSSSVMDEDLDGVVTIKFEDQSVLEKIHPDTYCYFYLIPGDRQRTENSNAITVNLSDMAFNISVDGYIKDSELVNTDIAASCDIIGMHQAWYSNLIGEVEDLTERPLDYLLDSAYIGCDDTVVGENRKYYYRAAMTKILIPNYIGILKNFTFEFTPSFGLSADTNYDVSCALASSDETYISYVGGSYSGDSNLIASSAVIDYDSNGTVKIVFEDESALAKIKPDTYMYFYIMQDADTSVYVNQVNLSDMAFSITYENFVQYKCFIDTPIIEYDLTTSACSGVEEANMDSSTTSLSYYSDSSAYQRIGKEYNNYVMYSEVIKFTTPDFDGKSEYVTFNIAKTSTSSNIPTLYYALCSSDENFAEYTKCAEPTDIVDDYKIVSDTLGEVSELNFAVTTDKLSPNTTYYLFLWTPSYSTSGTDAWVHLLDVADNHEISLTASSGEGTVVGYEFVEYECYIDNGTSWELITPYIDVGTN